METEVEPPGLAPAYESEILYRVLQGPQGRRLRQLATPDSALARISRAIRRIRRDLAKLLCIVSLVEQVAMSEPAFRRHFKSATALSPLQYPKRLRLLQARQILASQGKSATYAALDAGYESPTQFSREYARVIDLPSCLLRVGNRHRRDTS